MQIHFVNKKLKRKMKLILDNLYSYTALKAIYERVCVKMCIC